MSNVIAFPSRTATVAALSPPSPGVRLSDLSVGLLVAEPQSPQAATYSRHLCEQARLGEFDVALEELAAGVDIELQAVPLLAELNRTVVVELVRRAEQVHVDDAWMAVDALGIAPLLAETMVVGPDSVVHLVDVRHDHDDGHGTDFDVACGVRLTSTSDALLMDAPRGSWRAPETYEMVRCLGCAGHARRFPEARERPEGRSMTSAVAKDLLTVATERTVAQLRDDRRGLATCGAVAALELAESRFEKHLIEVLAEQAAAGGELVLRRILLVGWTYDYLEGALAACDDQGTLSELLSAGDWLRVVAGCLIDASDPDGMALGQVHMADEVRALLRTGVELRAIKKLTLDG